MLRLRPPYVPHVPLNLMRIGPKSLQKLEGWVLKSDPLSKTFAELADAVGEGCASPIIRAGRESLHSRRRKNMG